jgi:hypothetical protein
MKFYFVFTYVTISLSFDGVLNKKADNFRLKMFQGIRGGQPIARWHFFVLEAFKNLKI